MLRLIVSIVLIVSSVLVVVGISLPQYRVVKEIREYSEELKNLDTQLDDMIGAWNKVVNDYNKIKDRYVDKMEIVYGDGDDVMYARGYLIDLLDKYGSLARDPGSFSVESISVQSIESNDDSKFSEHVVTLDIQSDSFYDLWDLLGMMEYSLRVMDIKSVFLVYNREIAERRRKGLDTGDSTLYKMQVDGVMYWDKSE